MRDKLVIPEDLLEMRLRAYTMHNEEGNCITLAEEEWKRILARAEHQLADLTTDRDHFQTAWATELRKRYEYMNALTKCQPKVAEMEAQLKSSDDAIEALEKKYEDCPHHPSQEPSNCGCSYDRISDVCAFHAPALKKANAKVAELEAALAAMTEDRNAWRDGHNGDCPNEIAVKELQEELSRVSAPVSDPEFDRYHGAWLRDDIDEMLEERAKEGQ